MTQILSCQALAYLANYLVAHRLPGPVENHMLHAPLASLLCYLLSEIIILTTDSLSV